MKIVVLVVAVALISLVFVEVRRKGFLKQTETEWPFYAKRVLSPPEQILYHRLIKALPDHVVLAQVQVSRVLGVKKGFNVNEWNNRINRMSYDFVVCTKDATVLAAIELDDRSHEAGHRKEADARKERATASAGIRLIRWSVQALPDESAIAAAFSVGKSRPEVARATAPAA
jgi:hypothetical protein